MIEAITPITKKNISRFFSILLETTGIIKININITSNKYRISDWSIGS
jgi:hypothetical protein